MNWLFIVTGDVDGLADLAVLVKAADDRARKLTDP